MRSPFKRTRVVPAVLLALALPALAIAQGMPGAPVVPPATDAPAPASAAPDETPPPDRSRALPGASAVLLVETHAIGVDPIVGRFVNRQVRKSVESLGYSALGPEVAREQLAALEAGFPPSMADFWKAVYLTRAERGVFAVVWASRGRYVVQVRVASGDGIGPFYAQGDAGAEDLEARVDELVREALPPPGVTPEPQSEPTALTDDQASARGRRFFIEGAPDRPREPRLRRLRLALHSDSVFGIARDDFYNHLFGMRLDYRFNEEMSLGAYGGYANLRGRDGRVSSILTYLQVDNRVPVAPESDVAIPLRLGLGYLLRNGGVLRLGAGVAFGLSRNVELVFDLLTPTFWITPDKTLFSLDVGVELAFKL